MIRLRWVLDHRAEQRAGKIQSQGTVEPEQPRDNPKALRIAVELPVRIQKLHYVVGLNPCFGPAVLKSITASFKPFPNCKFAQVAKGRVAHIVQKAWFSTHWINALPASLVSSDRSSELTSDKLGHELAVHGDFKCVGEATSNGGVLLKRKHLCLRLNTLKSRGSHDAGLVTQVFLKM